MAAGETLADAYVRVRAQTQEAKQTLTKDMAEAGDQAGKDYGHRFGSGMLSTVKTAAAAAAATLGGIGLFNLAKSGIQTAASLEQAQVAFTTLIGNAKTAQSFLDNLKSFAAATPFELPGLVDNARLLLGVGVAAKDVIPDLTAWGDAAGALGLTQDRFNSALLAVTQSMGAGKINAQDMNQIINAGIPIWRLMSEATGKSQAELRKLSSEGKLLSSDILPAVQKQMEKDYGGAMAKQSQTLAGVWSTLMDTLHIGLANTLQPLVPVLENAIPKAANILTTALSKVSSGGAVLIGFVQGLAKRDGPILAQVIAFVRTTVEGLVTRIVSLATGVVRLVESWRGVWLPVLGAVVTAVRSGLIPALQATIGALATAINWLSSSNKWVGLLRATIEGIVIALVAYATVMGVIRAATIAWTAVQAVLNFVMSANPIGIIIVAVGALVAAIVYLATKTRFFQTVWAALWDFLKAIGSWFAGPFVNFFKSAGDAIASVPGRIRDQFFAVVGWFADLGRSIVDGIVNGLTGAWHFLTDKIKDLAHDALDVAKHALGISSPSKRFADEVGRQIPAGIQKGIDDFGDVIVPTPRFPGSPGFPGAGAMTTGSAVGGSRVIANITNNVTAPIDEDALAKKTVSRLVFALGTGAVG